MTDIEDYCYGCTEPIYVGEPLVWRIPFRMEWEEAFHEECVPSTFFVEEDEVYKHTED